MQLIAMGIYLALGDSISIDDYTGLRGGGAPSQLARKLGIELVDLTRDGNTTQGVLADLARAPTASDVVTLTAGGNDLLLGDLPRAILRRLHQIALRIQPLGAHVVVNTVYDPSDGDNDVGRRELGLSRLATIELRRRLNAVNRGIAKLAREHGFVVADLEWLFHGHGVASDEPWFVQVLEPNLAGATAIAEHWYQLLTSASKASSGRDLRLLRSAVACLSCALFARRGSVAQALDSQACAPLSAETGPLTLAEPHPLLLLGI